MGKLRYKNGIIQGEVNGDGKADFEIKVNLSTLIAGDFFSIILFHYARVTSPAEFQERRRKKLPGKKLDFQESCTHFAATRKSCGEP